MLGMINSVFAVMGRFASPLLAIFGILLAVAFSVIGLVVLYFVIKAAVKSALRENHEEKELRERRA